MKNLKTPPATATKTLSPILKQLVRLIPTCLVNEAAKECAVISRSFTPWSHIFALLFQQITRCDSLNGVCDTAKVYASEWTRMRGAEIPHRNTFSNANRRRNPEMGEKLYWKLLQHFETISPDFAAHKYTGYLARFKNRVLKALDSSTIRLTLNCFDWARHRREKAAAKMHMTLNIGNRMPSLVIVEEASHHDSARAQDAIAELKPGDVLMADRAYTDFKFMHSLSEKGVFFVMRQKANFLFEVVSESSVETVADNKPGEAAVKVLSDEKVRPATKKSQGIYTTGDGSLRRVTAMVEYDGKKHKMSFLTNNFEWSARTIAELYRSRWSIELFFKELKQTCQLQDFIGYNENAVKWQIWIGLLVHLLYRYLYFLSSWKNSFSRLAGIVRTCVLLQAQAA